MTPAAPVYYVPPTPHVDRSRDVVPADFAIGAVLGAAGATQGVALPGALALGFGYDALIAGVSNAAPQWFPRGSLSFTPQKIAATGIGIVLGWGLLRLLSGDKPPPRWAPAAVAIGAALVGGAAAAGKPPFPMLRAGG